MDILETRGEKLDDEDVERENVASVQNESNADVNKLVSYFKKI